MTKYACLVEKDGVEESVALFSDEVPTKAMYLFAQTCYEEDDRFENVRIKDLDNGEILYDVVEENATNVLEGCFDEMGYNPYMGCYDFDC